MTRFLSKHRFGFRRRQVIPNPIGRGSLEIAEAVQFALAASDPRAALAPADIVDVARSAVEERRLWPAPQLLVSVQTQERPKRKRGRKPTRESRAAEIRSRLIQWQNTPTAFRSSLRALAAEIGVSHQLLCFYLKGLGKWQMKESRRKMQEIRRRAETEGRPMTQWEESQVRSCERTNFQAMLDSVLSDVMKSFQAAAKARSLTTVQVKALKLLAQRGVPQAKQILAKYHEQVARPMPDFRSSEAAMRALNAAKPKRSTKLNKNNLPPAPSDERKSFRFAP